MPHIEAPPFRCSHFNLLLEAGIKMKVFDAILIIAGLIMGAYPLADQAYTRHLEAQLIDDWEVPLIQEELSFNTMDDFDQLQSTFEEELGEQGETALLEPIEAPLFEMDADTGRENPPSGNKTKANKSSSRLRAIGRIEIPKIQAKIPILEGASKANLKVGAGHITGTSDLGSVGNTALAAHRSHTYGKMFNRLDEVEVGDTIFIETSEGNFEYVVYKILVVTPDDISVLYPSKEDRVLTLITCTPLYTATHRLVVHAVMR